MRLLPDSILQKSGFTSIREEALRFCRTPSGARQLEDRVPDNRIDVVKRQLSFTDEMLSLIGRDDPLPLDDLPELHPALKKSRIRGALLDTNSILQIARLCAISRQVLNYFKKRDDAYPLLSETAQNLVPDKDLEESIRKILTDEGNIKDSASPELRKIRNALIHKRNDVRTVLNRILQKASKDGMTSEEGITIRGGRMVIPIKAEHKRHISGFIHDISATGQTVYLEPAETLNINNDIRQLENEEQRETEKLIRELTSGIGLRAEQLENNLVLLGSLDAVHAIASLGSRMNASVPQLSEDGNIELQSAFNPLLVLRSLHNEQPIQKTVIPLDLTLTPDELCLVITGPNAGGKSVAMKTVGLSALMVQSGYPIPASPDSRIPVFAGIALDQGDDQSIENDLSTFSSRLTWMSETLKHLQPETLILIDEAGDSTDPEEGSALYQAFIEALIDKKCRIIVTTHHGNLKTFAHQNKSSVNGSMQFDQEHLTPTYRFRKGLPGGSYAFEIAKRLGLRQTVINRAKKLLGSSKNTLESLIVEMEQKIVEAEHLKNESEQLKKEADARKHEYEDKRQALMREQDSIREKALTEAREIILNANRQIEETVKEIREEQAAKESIKKAHKQVKEQQKTVDEDLQTVREKRKIKTSSKPPKVGDTIQFEGNQSLGELVELNDGKAVILMNGMRLKTAIDRLVKVEQPSKPGKKKKRVPVIESSFRSGSGTLDIRGYRGDEALKAVTDFIDRAVVSGLFRVEIIHGKGEGILKQLIHDYLSGRPEISHFETAPWDSGGPGCTIVDLGS